MPQVSLEELITAAKAGQLVSFPTDTVPALAIRPENSRLIFGFKKRPTTKPLILMAASLEDLLLYLDTNSSVLSSWQQLAQKYWPGALTLVLPASDSLPKAMNPHNPQSIGVRVPDLEITREILAQTGPLATTSANLSGQPTFKTMAAVATAFPEVITLDYPGTDTTHSLSSGIPSTVAKWTGKGWEILRQGSIQLEDASKSHE